MLLDSLKIDNINELHGAIRTILSHSAIGEVSLQLEQMAEAQYAIAMELSEELSRTHSPQSVWRVIISVLRCLPWAIDPEDSQEPSLYRYFGGLEHSSPKHEELFNSVAEKVHNQENWQDIVNYASNELQVKGFFIPH